MMAVSINTRPSIRVVRILLSASGWRAMPSTDFADGHAYGDGAARGGKTDGDAAGEGLLARAAVGGSGGGLTRSRTVVTTVLSLLAASSLPAANDGDGQHHQQRQHQSQRAEILAAEASFSSGNFLRTFYF